ncbi:MAG: hypothetical protein HZB43_07305 [candidate division Zixibacteria bacterium]|nr:hypothetical protein [candidate division Zixibacteria bacterium]
MKIRCPKPTLAAIVGIAILGLLAGPAYPATLILPIQGHQVLTGDKGTSGILIDIGSLDTLAGSKILYAKCYLNIAVDSCADMYNALDAKSLVAQWSALATGSISLTDTSAAMSTRAFAADIDIGRGANGDTEILVTELLKAWLEGRMANNGFVLLPRNIGCSYELLSRAAYPGNGYGKLLIKFVGKTQ